jgi:hypothetical protein
LGVFGRSAATPTPDALLGDVLGYSSADIAALREAGTLG